MAQDVYVNERAGFGVFVLVGHFAREPVIVIAEILEVGSHPTRHIEVLQESVGRCQQ